MNSLIEIDFCVIVGVKDKILGERPVGVIPTNTRKLVELKLSQLPNQHELNRIKLVELGSIPYLLSGKPDRLKLMSILKERGFESWN